MSSGLFLHFAYWACGHHCERPADIPVASPEQALLICRAISHAISQPGNARAFLVGAETAELIYIDDDSISVGMNNGAEPGPEASWPNRPVVYYGSAEEQERLHGDALAEALLELPEIIERWDGTKMLYAEEVVSTTLPLDQLEAAAVPLWYGESRKRLFAEPPVFRPLAPLLAELAQIAGEISADEGSV